MYRDLLLLNIRLLCQYRKDEVIKYAKKKYYPLQDCLEICKKYHADFAAAYLLQRSGAYADSIHAYIGLLESAADKFFAGDKDRITASLDEYRTTYAQALKVCLKNAVVAGKDRELWFLLLDHLYELWKRLCRIHPETVGEKNAETAAMMAGGRVRHGQRTLLAAGPVGAVVKSVYECIQTLSSTLMQYVSFDDLILHIISRHGELEMENFKAMLGAMVASYLYQQKIFDLARLILSKSLKDQLHLLVALTHKGVSVDTCVCTKCGQRVNLGEGEEFMTFPCGHIYHPLCLRAAPKVCEFCFFHNPSNRSIAQT